MLAHVLAKKLFIGEGHDLIEVRKEAWGAAVDYTLNPMVQGGGICCVLGFPTRGHAHNTNEKPPVLTVSAQGFVNWRTPKALAQYNKGSCR